jgi:hypothetical protein
VLWTDRTGQSSFRDLTLKVATAWKHGTSRSDPGVDRFDPGTKAACESVLTFSANLAVGAAGGSGNPNGSKGLGSNNNSLIKS